MLIENLTLFCFVTNLQILYMLQERCAAAETISLVARLLHRSRAHLQSMLVQHSTNLVEDFFGLLVFFFLLFFFTSF